MRGYTDYWSANKLRVTAVGALPGSSTRGGAILRQLEEARRPAFVRHIPQFKGGCRLRV